MGRVFYKLTVQKLLGRRNKHTYWLCLCACGSVVEASSNSLKRGKHQSCGCGHGLSRTREYEAWYNMKLRCGRANQPSSAAYQDVKIYQLWLDSFETFLADVGVAPGEGYTLDRINPYEGYLPHNVRWLLGTEQARNKRRHALVRVGDKVLKTWEYAVETGLSVKAAYQKAYRLGILIPAR